MSDREKDIAFIKGFTKITIAKIAKNLKINRTAIFNKTTSDENLHKVRQEIISEIAQLFLLYIRNDENVK